MSDPTQQQPTVQTVQEGGSTVTYTQDLQDGTFMGTYPATSQTGGKKRRAKKSIKSRSSKKAWRRFWR